MDRYDFNTFHFERADDWIKYEDLVFLKERDKIKYDFIVKAGLIDEYTEYLNDVGGVK